MVLLSDSILATARAQAFHILEDNDGTKSTVQPLGFPIFRLAHELVLELKGS